MSGKTLRESNFRRRLILSLLYLTGKKEARIWVTRFFVIKGGKFVPESELEAMRYVTKYTTIPLPKIYLAFEHRGNTYIVMQKVKGQKLFEAWTQMSEDDRERLRCRLRGYLGELRALPPPQPGRIGSANYNALQDIRYGGETGAYGPFDSTTGLHGLLGTEYILNKALDPAANLYESLNVSYLNEAIKPGEDAAAMAELARKFKSRTWATKFTHGDLSSFNILEYDNEVSCLLDWEMSGWLPEYWEYTSSWHCNPYDRSWWPVELGKILESYPEELKMDGIRRLIFPVY